ncbi:hypothetical protein CsatB_023685 [Cannabis sativa]|uniref:intracellular protein transport protein USO1-like n=1 Tax=Cannabis sativa TaxID=3483 RepID=UPI0029CA8BFA|nr:intracellular protein transport protein USO1-like [Cannabis sativa]
MTKSKDSRGCSSDRPEQTRGASELIKAIMLTHYVSRSVPEVKEQLAGADNDLSLELVMGGVMKELSKTGLKMAYAYSRAKLAASKNAAISNTMRTEVDLARKDIEEARVQLGAVRIELGEVNKKLLAAEKKVAELTKDLQATDQLEAAIASLSKEVTSLQEEREVLRSVFRRLEEEKKTKEEELRVEVKKYKSEVGQQRSEVERLGGKMNALETTGLKIFYDFWKANP